MLLLLLLVWSSTAPAATTEEEHKHKHSNSVTEQTSNGEDNNESWRYSPWPAIDLTV